MRTYTYMCVRRLHTRIVPVGQSHESWEGKVTADAAHVDMLVYRACVCRELTRLLHGESPAPGAPTTPPGPPTVLRRTHDLLNVYTLIHEGVRKCVMCLCGRETYSIVTS